MVDILYPPWLRTSKVRFDFVSNTEAARSIFSGATNSVGRSGDRVRATLTTSNATDQADVAERAILKALYANFRGQANRIWIADPSYRQRGSFPSQELLTNNTFASGTTGWAAGAGSSISVADRIMRLNPIGGIGGNVSQSVSLTQNIPYALRSILLDGSQTSGLLAGASINDISGQSVTNYQTTRSMLTAAIVPVTSGAALQYPCVMATTSGYTSGAYLLMPWASLSRCALIDNGSNLITYSDQLDNAAWTKARSTITANGAVAPDGTTIGDWLVEDSTASETHYATTSTATVSSSPGDVCFTVALVPSTRTWVHIALVETAAETVLGVYFNLSTGAIGATPAVGANWSNFRTTTPVELGNNWKQYTIIARKTNSATGVYGYIAPATGDGAQIYTGDGASKIGVWRATIAQSSVPVRLSQTTSAATTGTAQTGSNLYVKGLPPSTNGLLLMSDWVQSGTDLNMIIASLDSDAAGLGYLQLYRPLRTAPADNDPVIVNTPMGRFVATSNEGGWDDSPGGFSDFEREFEEALDL